MSFFRTGACQNLVEVLDAFKVKGTGIQKVKWTGKGQQKVGKYFIPIFLRNGSKICVNIHTHTYTHIYI